MQIYGPSHVHGAQPTNAPHINRTAPSAGEMAPAFPGDQLDISEAGQLAARIGELPDIRGDLVARVRASIADGSYETPDKLDVALDRLLDEVG